MLGLSEHQLNELKKSQREYNRRKTKDEMYPEDPEYLPITSSLTNSQDREIKELLAEGLPTFENTNFIFENENE